MSDQIHDDIKLEIMNVNFNVAKDDSNYKAGEYNLA
jgi:hypothetical protein